MTREEYLRCRGWFLTARPIDESWGHGKYRDDLGRPLDFFADDAERRQLDDDRDALQYLLERRAVVLVRDLGNDVCERVVLGTEDPKP